jgi:hypothetical protein
LKDGTKLIDSNEDDNTIEDAPRDTLVSHNGLINLDENGFVDDVATRNTKIKSK